nr:hypothetical protein [Variovorax sp. DXTD-1]
MNAFHGISVVQILNSVQRYPQAFARDLAGGVVAQLPSPYGQAASGVVDMAVGASRVAACFHARRNGLIRSGSSRCVVTTVTSDNRNAFVVVCGFDLAIRATLLLAAVHCYLRRFSLASLVSGHTESSLRRIYCDRSPSALPLLRCCLGCSLFSIWTAHAEAGTRAVSNLTGRALLGERNAAPENPQTCHQRPIREVY